MGLLSSPSRGIPKQGNRASICVEGGISRSFPICSRKLWFPSSCDGDLREFLMVPMGSQESFGVVRALRGIKPQFSWKGESQGVFRVAQVVGVPSCCHVDLRVLLMVPIGSQESCLVVRCLSGFPWGRCNGGGPHLQLRREPQGSSPVLTWISGCVCSFKQRVRSRFELRHETLLSSLAVKDVSGIRLS